MSRGASACWLADGRRLHLQHGPIDLIIEVHAAARVRTRALDHARQRFATILDELVSELPALRRVLAGTPPPLRGPTARRMLAATWPHRRHGLTPMASVAGAVADEVLAAITAAGRIERAYVNNGGDIAVHLADGQSLTAGIVSDLAGGAADATCLLCADQPARGVATSGWRGRSFSLGIADAVTVLAANAAAADAAATLVANAVDAPHAAIQRRPARDIDEHSDLGDWPVTVAVGELPPHTVQAALERGARLASEMLAGGLLHGALLGLAGQRRTVGSGNLLAP